MNSLVRNRNNYRTYDGNLQVSKYASNYTIIPINDNRSEENTRKADLDNFLRQAGTRDANSINNPVTNNTYEPNVMMKDIGLRKNYTANI
jgi:hypothetical protein